MASGRWKKLSSKIVYKTPWIRVREDKIIRPDGSHGVYSLVQTKGPAVMIVPISDNNEVYLIKHSRYTVAGDSWEVPGGNSDGEEILSAAKRELVEETGLAAKNWELIGQSQSMNGITDEKTYTFIAKDLKQTKSNAMKEEGILEIKQVPFNKVLEMIKKSEITDGQSIVAIMKAALFFRIA